jgi:hypothetical protein
MGAAAFAAVSLPCTPCLMPAGARAKPAKHSPYFDRTALNEEPQSKFTLTRLEFNRFQVLPRRQYDA